MSHAQARLGHSQRRICRALGISRSAVRYEPQPRVDESALTGSIVGLAGIYKDTITRYLTHYPELADASFQANGS